MNIIFVSIMCEPIGIICDKKTIPYIIIPEFHIKPNPIFNQYTYELVPPKHDRQPSLFLMWFTIPSRSVAPPLPPPMGMWRSVSTPRHSNNHHL